MWLLYAAGSAFFAGVTAILAKAGIRHTPSNLATALRTIVVLAFAWLMVFVVGSQAGLASLDGRTLLFLDTSEGASGAAKLYEQLGYMRCGGIPDYAMDPDGTLKPNVIFAKRLA